MPIRKTPKQRQAEKARKAARNPVKTHKGDGRDRDATTVTATDDRACTQDDQSNLIYVGGNYMGSPDYQEAYHQNLMQMVELP